MIAAPPFVGSDVPVLTGHSVLLSQELSQAYWSIHWDSVLERTKAFYTAYYATDPDVIRRFIDDYDIGYWVLQRAHFSATYLDPRVPKLTEPFNEWIRTDLQPSPGALLSELPDSLMEFSDGLHSGISSAALTRWLTSR